MFNVSLIRPYQDASTLRPPIPEPPPPEILDDELEYEVEKILDSRISRRKLQYLVKWKGYNDSHNQWIPWYNLQADDLIDEYHRTHPEAERLRWAAGGVSP